MKSDNRRGTTGRGLYEQGRQGDFFNYINEERIQPIYKSDKKSFYFDNYDISSSYGQANIEKCLFVIFLIVLYSALLIYCYYLDIHETIMYFFIFTTGVDICISFFYIYFLIKLKSGQIFNHVPLTALDCSDILILINFLVKTFLFVFFCLHYFIIGLLGIALFSLKFLIDIYFILISVKFLMMCACSLYVQEKLNVIWVNVKYYVCCCEVESVEPENADYTKLEDIESFY
jgi:hypothetical protein